MSDTTTPAERMEKALARAQAFVKLHGHDNTACITSGELLLFREALKCAQTEIEHWDKLYLMMSADEQRLEANVARLTKERDWLANKLIDCPPEFTNCALDCAECRKEAARRAVAAGEEICQK